MRKLYLALSCVLVIVFVASCDKDEPEEPQPTPAPEDTSVRFDLSAIPYPNLSDYKFFTGSQADMVPNDRVLPYDVITPLFSDYAKKKRFIWMPEGVKATYVADNLPLDCPNGTVFIKSFYFEHVQPEDKKQILETRLLYKKDGVWHFADYTWNEDQTDAHFDLNGSYVPLQWKDDEGDLHDVTFRIPNAAECFTCHKRFDINTPIGTKPQNLFRNYDYADGTMNQFSKLVQEGYLDSNYPSSIVTVPNWADEGETLENRVRAYVDANCSHCHQEGGHCSYRPMRFAFSETSNPTNLGVCVEPEEYINSNLTHVIARGNTARSVMHFRISSVSEQYRMPLLGRTVLHEEGVALITDYINSLSPACE